MTNPRTRIVSRPGTGGLWQASARRQFSISAGKLPTLVGAELPFARQNTNIERGLLWWQEPVSAAACKRIIPAGRSRSHCRGTTVTTPMSGTCFRATSPMRSTALTHWRSMPRHARRRRISGNQIYDLMYTYNADPWTFGPYVQYQGIRDRCGAQYGIGAPGVYQFNPQWSLNGRVEYEKFVRRGFAADRWTEKSAWSITVTQTWQKASCSCAANCPMWGCPTKASASARPSATTVNSAPCWK